MTPEMRERIIKFNKQNAERKAKAEDLDDLLLKLKPVFSTIIHVLPDDAKAILRKYISSI